MKLVVVDDSKDVRNGLIALLHSHSDIDIVGMASTETEAIRLILASAPDVVLLDIGLAMGNGVRVLESIRRQGCQAYVIMMTVMSHDAYREVCLRLGADEFRDKTQEFEAMLDSLFERAARIAPAEVLKSSAPSSDNADAAQQVQRTRLMPVSGMAEKPSQGGEPMGAPRTDQPERL